MSYWARGSSQPYGRVPNLYNNDQNNISSNSLNYNFEGYYGTQYPSDQLYQNHAAEASNSSSQNFTAWSDLNETGHVVESSIVTNSTLTPLAKEFTPRSNFNDKSPFYDSKNKNHGAIKKGTYWNKEGKHNKHESKQSNSNYNYNECDKSENFNNYKYGRINGKRNVHVEYNKSFEQNQVLEDTKTFLQQLKNPVDDSTENFSKNVYRENIQMNGSERNFDKKCFSQDKNFKPSGETNVNKSTPQGAYSKGTYNNRNKSYKNNYNKKDDYNQSDKKYENETNNSNYRFYERKFNYQSSNERSDADRKKNHEYRNKKFGHEKMKKQLDAASQRERLQQQIASNALECLVCCERIRHTDEIWSCKQCYHILHLQCTKQWAQSSKLEAGWRCPACQNVYQDIPNKYLCYCTKQTNPSYDPNEIPHSCGRPCSRVGRSCSHTCTLICHPGPCPDCSVMVPRSCGCGATKPILKCSSTIIVTCERICGKVLSCGLHKCDKKCHPGDCEECILKVQQECYCEKQGRKVRCSAESRDLKNYECGDICDKLLECGNHRCEQNCHKGECSPCLWSPNKVSTCPCGQTKLVNERKSCLDDIPCCDKTCNKKLLCGQPSSPHLCKSKCHPSLCPTCSLTTIVKCRCGHMDKEIPCEKVTTKADDARCEKKCTKKRLCGKHKCNQFCCIEIDHICPLPCNRSLSCGQHRCEETCHKGRCPPCWRTSFDELYCECGSTVLYPPIACGTRPPPCDQPCSRSRACDHEVLHNCHTGPCPPCTVLCKRWCYGNHQQRSTIQCHQESFSCGLPCGIDMSCKRHKCIQPCHTGNCKVPCVQPCTELRAVCGHPCNQPCHEPPCPETSCKKSVVVTCQCGFRKGSRICHDLAGEYQSLAMSQLVSTIEEMQLGHAVDLTEVVNVPQKYDTLKILECNEECRLMERNRRLAIGLQIRNPDLSSKLSPRYSEFMRNWAKKDPKFCQNVHDKLSELVKLAKQSKQKSRSYSFESMNRDKRHFVHECCEHFGCESVAYDPEPNRNVVATAFKDKSWLPSSSLLEVIQRENGQRKVPGPQQLGKRSPIPKAETVSLKLSGRTPSSSVANNDYIDYFDNPPK